MKSLAKHDIVSPGTWPGDKALVKSNIHVW